MANIDLVWLNFWLFVWENRCFIFFCFRCYFKYWACSGLLCTITESFNLCDLLFYVYFHGFSFSFPYLETAFVHLATQACQYEIFGFLWLKAGSAILHCFLHLKAGTFNTASFYLVIHCSITVIHLNSEDFFYLSKLFFSYMQTYPELVNNKH